MEGLLQAIIAQDVCPNLRPLGLIVGALMPTVLSESSSSERWGSLHCSSVSQACSITWGAVKNQIPGPCLGSSASAPPKEGPRNLSF